MNETGNTEIIISSFIKGYDCDENTYELFSVSKRSDWKKIKEAFYNNDYILIAFPLFAESLPSILWEFLKYIHPVPEIKSGRRLAFILQCASLESCQRTCCEKLLDKLPEKLNCFFNGTLSVGDMFGLWLDDSRREEKLKPIENAGFLFAKDRCFFESEVKNLSEPEYVTESEAKIISRIKKFMINEYAEKLGCNYDLMNTPYLDSFE